MRVTVAALLLAACHGGGSGGAGPDASSLHASDITSEVLVRQTETNLQVAGGFQLAGGTPLPADAGVKVTVTIAGMATDVSLDGNGTFVMTTSTPIADDTPIDVTLVVGGDTATSHVTMPASFTVGQVTGTLSQPPITFAWSPTSSDAMHWEVSAASATSGHTCSANPQVQEPPDFTDSGTMTLHGTFGATGIGCTETLWLDRIRTGTPASNLAPMSTIVAEQSRAVARA